MDIAFRVRNVEVPANLRRVTQERVTRLGRRCGIDRADVCFSERRNPRSTEREMCQITLFGPGRILRAQAAATNVAVAADRVVGKLERRADRLRGRSMDHRHRRGGAGSVHCPGGWSTVTMRPGAGDHVGGDAGEAADMGISDSRTEPMTPEEAAVAMCERGSDIFSFHNAETGRGAVICCRADGEIALWEAPVTAEVVR
jgi:ribosomal subunit interface protein